MQPGKIAVLGGGTAAHGTAGDLALRGFEVHMWARNPLKLARVFQTKRIEVVAPAGGTAVLAGASGDLVQTLKGAKLIVVLVPGYAQRDVAEQCIPFLEDGQKVVVCSNSGLGSLEFARTLREKGVKKDVLCAEYSGVPSGGRFLEPGVINSSRRFTNTGRDPKSIGIHIGVFPAARTPEFMELVADVFPRVPSAENCLEAALIPRAITHQPICTLLSVTAIEHFHYWDITMEGRTPTVAKLNKILDDERKAIGKAWGFKLLEVWSPSALSGEQDDNTAEKEPKGPDGSFIYRVRWAWKDRLDMHHRFVTEAVPYGYVLRSSAAAKVGVKVPVMDSVIRIFSAINNEDYFSTGRSLESLGLGNMNFEQINHFLHEGYR